MLIEMPSGVTLIRIIYIWIYNAWFAFVADLLF